MSEHAAAEAAASSFPPAGLDRRFYAFTLDRLLIWTLDALVVLGCYELLLSRGSTGLGVAVLVALVLLVWLGFALLLGLRGTSPGRAALGLRVVSPGSGSPIGVPAALLRGLLLGVATLPTFGLGVATLAWTAVMDRGRQRRGWHDHVSGSIVVDVRPIPVESDEAAPAPRQIVNLTAMRLVPAPQPPEVRAPARSSRPVPPAAGAAPAPQAPAPQAPAPQAPAPQAPAPLAPAPEVRPAKRRRQLGPPLVDLPPEPPGAQPPAARPPLGPPPVGAPVGPAGPPPAAPSPAAAAPARPGHATAERTVMRSDGPAPGPDGSPARRGPALWRVAFDSGETFVVEGLALVGRRPESRPGEPVRHLVPLRSGDMSLSKTHAQFQVAPDGVLVVMDRGSTNGSILVRQGVGRELAAGRPATLLDGDRVRFGDREMTVTREH